MEKMFDHVAAFTGKFKDELLRVPEAVKKQTFDIRIKSEQPICICGRQGVLFLKGNGLLTKRIDGAALYCTHLEMQELFFQICTQSVFSHENEIREGYISLEGGYRVGICGAAVMEGREIKTIKDISSLVFRIPREIPGCADRLFLQKVDFTRGLLIVGAPSSGKTTFLRDVALSLSSGKFSACRRVAILDERGEIGGSFPLGPGADLLKGYPKKEGFNIAIRVLSPEFLLCDELGDEDFPAVKQAMFAGVPLIATVHASRNDFFRRPFCRRLLESGAFHTLLFLSSRESFKRIESIETLEALFRLEKTSAADSMEDFCEWKGRRKNEGDRGNPASAQRVSNGLAERAEASTKGVGAA